MHWLKKARFLKGITSKELAAMVGKSQIYLQKIEGGEKPLNEELAANIYAALGFSPRDIPFDTENLIQEIRDYDDESAVRLGFVLVGRRIYFNSAIPAEDNGQLIENSLVVSARAARLLLQSQLSVLG